VPKNAKEDPVRENRISDEIIVDAYGEEEQAMGWYYYLEEKLQFPFLARCIIRREISPLQVGDEAKVMGPWPCPYINWKPSKQMIVLLRQFKTGIIG
jgi:hypothetical protein